MKKIYAFLLASAVAASATAVTPVVKGDLTVKTNVSKHQVVNSKLENTTVTFKKVAELDGTPIKPLDKVGDTYTITGEYVVALGDYYFETSVGPVEEMVEVFQAGENVYVIDPLDANSLFPSQVPFVFDAATNTLTFSFYSFGTQNGGYDVAFTPFYWDNDLEDIVFMDYYQVEFDASNGEIGFELDHGFAWPAYTDEDNFEDTMLGFVNLFDVNEMIQEEVEPIDEIQEGQWKTVGNASFVDGWVLPGWGENGADYPCEVELQQNVNNENLYRLWEPYKNDFVLADQNLSEYHGQIVFDITDPEHVVIAAGLPAGYMDEYDNKEQYNFGLLGWQIHGFGADYDADLYFDLIVNFMEENDQAFDTFDSETGVITITKPVFDYSRKCGNAYSWKTVYPATITLPEGSWAGVNKVEVEDNTNAPVRYYNLQGVEVANPTEGALYIKVEGKTATKFVK